MNYIGNELLSGEIVPVLLGVSPEAVETAREMFRKYRVLSHVFCQEIPLPYRFMLSMKFHKVRHSSHDRMMITALEDFANQIVSADVILYLIPCTEEYTRLIWRNREQLETRYVISSPTEIHRTWFGEKTAESAPGSDPTTERRNLP